MSREPLSIDPALRELFLRKTGRSWDLIEPESVPSGTLAVVAKLTRAAADVPGLNVVARFGQIVTGRVAYRDIVDVRRHPEVLSLKASRLYSGSLMVSVPDIAASPDRLSGAGVPGVDGTGVIIGIADWGLDFGHECFRNADGTTRIVAIWDQRGGETAASPAPFGYGREILAAEIDAALLQDDPYEALGYDPAADGGDGAGTHGTHVASIAAGSGPVPGVAPGAGIIFVHLTSNDTSPLDTLGDSARVLEAARYIKDAAAGRPVILNFSMGRTGGPKDGTTLVEQALDELCAEDSGCSVVMSTGNYFNARQHASGTLNGGQQANLRWEVQTQGAQAAEMEIWYPGPCSLLAQLIDPAGRVVASVPPGEEFIVRPGNTIYASLYHRRGDPNNGDNQIDIFLWENAPNGEWTVRLLATGDEPCRFDAYVERDDPRSQSRFAESDADPWGTTNTVCNGTRTIATGAYDPHLPGRPMLPFSSAGPTRDGRQKPDCVAPGGGIRAARSTVWIDGVRAVNGYTVKSGTSMAAPHVAGTLALLFQAAAPARPSAAVMKRVLLESCRGPVSTRSGAGRIDASRAISKIRQWRDTVAQPAESETTSEENQMPLIDAVKKICNRLAPHGWAGLFKAHGLDITATALDAELAKTLSGIKRTLPGFEDFAKEANRGIEPGLPSHSLLYHAFASSSVINDEKGRKLRAFPTLAELYTLENYVYAARKASIEDLKKKFGADLAVVAFSYEYRTLNRSVHGLHAETAYARTGIARVGTAAPRYVPELRGFTPLHESDAREVCVTPAQYGAFLAVRKKASGTDGPMDATSAVGNCSESDRDLEFWVPVHKLFSGTECVKGADIKVSKSMFHYCVKLRRLREYIKDTSGVDLSKPPFTITEGLAKWTGLGDPAQCPGLLTPEPKKRLVEYAKKKDGSYWSFPVDALRTATNPHSDPVCDPPSAGGFIASSAGISLTEVRSIPGTGGRNCCVNTRPAPEWIHVRYRVGKSGEIVDLNKQLSPDTPVVVRTENYNAAHLVDHTGEGWVEPKVEGLGPLKTVAAFSLISAPDFFPFCDQRELAKWNATISAHWEVPPRPLSQIRYPANPRIPGNKFTLKDKTCTAIVSFPYDKLGAGTAPSSTRRGASWLPDSAAGVFAPGWDVSIDHDSKNNVHLAQYGLGSPFPEDAMLCAALSAFWPAAAPDIARKFGSNPNIYTIAPLADDEVGKNGAIGFDGLPGPKIEKRADGNYAVFPRASHSDYVKSAIDKTYKFGLTAHIDTAEYIRRATAMQQVYGQLGVSGDSRNQYTVLSFTKVPATDPRIAALRFSEPVYRFVLTKQQVRDTPEAMTNAIKLGKLDEIFVNPDTKQMQSNVI